MFAQYLVFAGLTAGFAALTFLISRIGPEDPYRELDELRTTG